MDMKEQLNRLMLLQSTQKDIARARKDKADLQKDVKSRLNVIEQLEADIEKVHEERIANQKKGDALELNIQAKKEENHKLQIQLNTTKSQKDYDAIRKNILNNKADASKWEDEELEALEQVDSQKKKEAELKARISEEKNKLQDVKNAVKQSEKKYDADIEKLSEKKRRLREQIDTDLLSKYDQIANSSIRRALVKVKGRVCGGCFTQVPKQLENELMRRDKAVLCHNCGRILMLDETG